jgi:hypothetical protein
MKLFCVCMPVFLLLSLSCRKESNNNVDSTHVQESSLKKISVEEWRISINVPKSWTGDWYDETSYSVLPACDSLSNFCTSLVIRSIENSNQLSLPEISELFIANLPSLVSKHKLMGVTKFIVNEIEFYLVDFTALVEEINVGSTVGICLIDNEVLTFNFMAENDRKGSYVNHREVFISILSSIKIN